jgi:hypothetical protein
MDRQAEDLQHSGIEAQIDTLLMDYGGEPKNELPVLCNSGHLFSQIP